MILTLILSYWFVLFSILGVFELFVKKGPQLALARERWPVNIVLILMSAGLAGAVPLSGLSAALWAQGSGVGILNSFNVGAFVGVFISVLTLSLWDYLVHLASHKIPLLWRFHKIHHSDQHLDVTTTFRVHPLMHLILSLANVVLVMVIGLNPMAVAYHAVIVLLLDLSHHTALPFPAWLDAAMRPYIITPSLHHIHHSDDVKETDTNYGHDLAIWDRIFGTYQPKPLRSPEKFRYGLKKFPAQRANDLHSLLLAPFRKDPFS